MQDIEVKMGEPNNICKILYYVCLLIYPINIAYGYILLALPIDISY